ncbi:MAG: hypothetical protein ACLF0P_02925 [Thermoanaerobaculia bacterium]
MSRGDGPVLPGINRVFEHEGSRYLIECEDRGTGEAAFELRVIRGGSQLWSRRVEYGDLVAKELGEGELEHELTGRVEKAIQTVQAAIARGKLG